MNFGWQYNLLFDYRVRICESQSGWLTQCESYRWLVVMFKKSIQFNPGQKAWIASGGQFPETIELLSLNGDSKHSYKVLERQSDGAVPEIANRCGFKGFVLKVQDVDTGSELAVKLCLKEDYEGESNELNEARLAAALAPASDLFLTPLGVGLVELNCDSPDMPKVWSCFVSPWIEGDTIESLLKNDDWRKNLTPLEVAEFGRTLYKAAYFLRNKSLRHDDLHLGNVMLEDIDKDLGPSTVKKRLKIIDCGSLKPSRPDTNKPFDDLGNVISALVELRNVLFQEREKLLEHPSFDEYFKELIEHLSDEDTSRFFSDPDEPFARFDELSKRATLSHAVDPPTRHPFDAISAENLADDRRLLDTFVNQLPWLEQFSDATPAVLSGPRGCGKSMAMRYLSAKTHTSAEKPVESFQKLSVFGVYIGCGIELQNQLLWMTGNQDAVLKQRRALVTFFQLLLARELVRSVLDIQSNSPDLSHALGFDSDVFTREFTDAVCSNLEISVEDLAASTSPTLTRVHNRIDALRRSTHQAILAGEPTEYELSESVLGELTKAVTAVAPALQERPIVFLLDDYSSGRVPTEVQRVLNKIIFARSPTHRMKISCEKFGFCDEDIDGSRIDEDREYVYHDAADLVMGKAKHPARCQFIADLVNYRLAAAGYTGEAEQLLGIGPFDTELALEIRQGASRRGGNPAYYHGIRTLANMWCGDIATILHILRRMFLDGGVDKDTTSKIKVSVQHASIQSVSNALRRSIRSFQPHGPALSEVIEYFSQHVHGRLVKGQFLSKDGKPHEPYRVPRIEMTVKGVVDLDELLIEADSTGESWKVMKELLRRALLIELDDSRAKEGAEFSTKRLEIRKSLLPAYNCAILKNTYVPCKTPADLVEFLLDPEAFWAKKQPLIDNKNPDQGTFESQGF